MGLEGKVAIVTGAGRGIGEAICLALAKKGVSIVAAARTKEEIRNTADDVRQLGSGALAVRTDVTKRGDVSRMVRKARKKFGRIAILVNNAGVAVAKPLLKTTEKEWNEIMEVNLTSIFHCSKAVLPVMLEQGEGTIINISSGAGKHGFPGLSAYSASKFGVIGLTEALAREVARHGIKVYAVCPGGVDTEMHRSLFPEADTSQLLKPEEVAEKVVELCSDSGVKTGSAVDVR